jgi:hypothetical protein
MNAAFQSTPMRPSVAASDLGFTRDRQTLSAEVGISRFGIQFRALNHVRSSIINPQRPVAEPLML